MGHVLAAPAPHLILQGNKPSSDVGDFLRAKIALDMTEQPIVILARAITELPVSGGFVGAVGGDEVIDTHVRLPDYKPARSSRPVASSIFSLFSVTCAKRRLTPSIHSLRKRSISSAASSARLLPSSLNRSTRSVIFELSGTRFWL